MASADLEYIRALLIAQTAEPEPETRGPFARWLSPKRQRRTAPLDLAPARATVRVPERVPERAPERIKVTVVKADLDDRDQELLLEKICGPAPNGFELAPPPFDLPLETPTEAPLALETASPLRPPSPRAEFGRRGDLEAEVELMLDQPASEPRRLRVLDVTGQPIGEMILQPDAREDAVPFFPEDLMEPHAPTGPEPMRPWIKALRNAGAPKREEPVERLATPKPTPSKRAKTSKPRRARAYKVAEAAPPPRPQKTPGLSRDLLEALALTLTREQETLEDRLAATADEALFE